MSLVDLGKRLLEAAKQGLTDEVRTLMSNGAPFTTDWLGTSPLHFAAQSGHVSTAEVLLRAGISRDARTKVDRTPLHVAAQEGHQEVVDLLIKNGADIEAKDMLKMTPLHWAVEKGHIPVIELFLGHGADITCENKFERTPVDIARTNGRTDLSELLQLSRLPQSNVVEVTTDPTVEVMTEATNIAEVVTSESPHHVTLVPASQGVRLVGADKDKSTSENSSTAVLATLAALAEATGPLNTATSPSTTEALNWLETHGITMISSGDGDGAAALVDSGQTLTLTEAGKLALNHLVKQQGLKVEQDGSDDDQGQRVITIVTDQGQITTEAASPMVLKLARGNSVDSASEEPLAKRIKLEQGDVEEAELVINTETVTTEECEEEDEGQMMGEAVPLLEEGVTEETVGQFDEEEADLDSHMGVEVVEGELIVGGEHGYSEPLSDDVVDNNYSQRLDDITSKT